MASLKDDKGALETRLFVVFNHNNDGSGSSLSCEHLQAIFNMLRQVPYKPHLQRTAPRRSCRTSLKGDFVDICRVIHNYSFDIFAHRVTKREHKLSDIRGYIDGLDQTNFTPQPAFHVGWEFLEDVAMIIELITRAQTTKQLPTAFIEMLLILYSHWTEHNILPEDSLSDNKFTLLDIADAWLASGA